MKFVRTLAAALALTLGFAGAALAGASGPTPMTTYHVAFTPVNTGGGEYDGTLNVRIADSGEISGTFRFDDTGLSHVVTGGRDGDHVWLDLGAGDHYRIDAELKGGKIVGATQGLGAFGDFTQPYAFTGTPTSPHL
jgi:hypothetical protein